MAIYYHKLWNIMKKKYISPKELKDQLNMSTATITKLRKNQPVSLETLDQIREYLGCDFGDIITSFPDSFGDTMNWTQIDIPCKANSIYREALHWYMDRNRLTAKNISTSTSLALNTVKDFLKGKDISLRSILKLPELGNEYNDKVAELLIKSGAEF
jgi:DNA-binding Xre family transcriptional regulator